MDKTKIKASARYLFRGDTAENWGNDNPLLYKREIGLILDENDQTIGFKVGDGKTSWNNLPVHLIRDTEQAFDANSENPMSGKAVAEAVEDKSYVDIADLYSGFYTMLNGSEVNGMYYLKFVTTHDNYIAVQFEPIDSENQNRNFTFKLLNADVSSINRYKKFIGCRHLIELKPDDKIVHIFTYKDGAYKQDKLTAGDNITIDENNVISATGGAKNLNQYYTSLRHAVYDANAKYENGASKIKNDNSVCSLYFDEQGVPNITILKDITMENEVGIYINDDLNLNLNGHKISFINPAVTEELVDYSFKYRYGFYNFNLGDNINGYTTKPDVTIKIDGRKENSEICFESPFQDNSIDMLFLSNCNVTVTGGKYSVISNKGYVFTNNHNLTLDNCNIYADVPVNYPGYTDAVSMKTYGVVCGAEATLHANNCTIIAQSPYSNSIDSSTSNKHGFTGYTHLSIGINNGNEAYLKDCIVYGSHTGVNGKGFLYIDGGEYRSYGHGGVYYTGNDSVYFQNATFGCWETNGVSQLGEDYKYSNYAHPNDAGITNAEDKTFDAHEKVNCGFYIGGTEGDKNSKCYIDNCVLDSYTLNENAGAQAIAVKSRSTNVYVSNSNIRLEVYEHRLGWPIRITFEENRVYMGVGNNFNKNYVYNKADSSSIQWPDKVIETDCIYTYDNVYVNSYVFDRLGDINNALDQIIALQNSILDGE